MKIRAIVEFEITPEHYPPHEDHLAYQKSVLIERLKSIWSTYREAQASVKVEEVK